MFFFVILVLLSCTEAEGLQHVFLLRGKDLHLNVVKSVELDKKTDFFWRFNTTNYVGKISYNKEVVLFDGYEGRVEVFGQNYSLLLKNVQHSDSGDYTAVVVGGQEQRVAQYKVIVQDPVSPVNLTVDSVSSGSGSCNLIVTCSTVDSQISSIFTCDAQNCSLVDRGSFKTQTYSSNLTVYLQQDSIVCNHSNQVSVKQTKEEIKLYCKEKPGLQHVFLLRGKDLHLDIKKSVVLDRKTDLFWKFNETNNVAKCGFNNDPVVFDKYEGRAEVFEQNYSLLLKNVQHNDSGDYTAVVSGGKDQNVAEYKVIVQDPVSPVNLTVDSVSGSSDCCNLIVTCSTVDSQISSIFTCDAQNCSLVEKGSFKAQTYSSNLIVYLQQDLIVCNHSNQVSVEQTKEEIKLYCKEKPGISICVVKTVVFSVGLIIMVLAVISVHIMEKIKKRK
ncbi:T-lymphocyte surface antigen Ly-9-like [Pelmatolapia mariae]|uniref:T-lymphocyte surface antigen Ly-9-like n=1 Tax=Pelmatolapia mariae TaxID=158779 RepID=UPI002FE665F1